MDKVHNKCFMMIQGNIFILYFYLYYSHTNCIFYRVLYFSIHRYENGQFWPNLRESDWDYTGSGDGQGFNINIPLNATGMKDTDYLAIFHQILLPIASEVCNLNNYFHPVKFHLH